MNKVAITVSALALTAALAGACSNSSDSEKPPALDEGAGGSGGGRVDGGGGGADDAGDEPDEDGGITDARDELVPIDADRGNDSGDGDPGDDGGDADVPPPPECISDEDCAGKLPVGVCEVAACRFGACTVEHAPLASPCDDGLDCSSGGLCKDGVCSPGPIDVTNPQCVDKPFPGALSITEVMATPRAIEGQVHATEGQWIEITNRAAKEVHVQGVHLVYFDWPSNGTEPEIPEYSTFILGDTVVDPEGALVVTRSGDPEQNGGLRSPFAFGNALDLASAGHAKLLLVMPEWGKNGSEVPIAPQYIIDSVYIPAGTFGEANQGRSWQASAPLPDPSTPESRVFCHTPEAASNAYVEEGAVKNYGTPRASNVGCDP